MSDELDVTKLQFSSSSVPTKEDLKLWDSLTPEQQTERTLYELEQAKASGIAKPESFSERLDRIKKQREKGGS